jgi:uncharacterized glyoxalase superfamily protein PhnB
MAKKAVVKKPKPLAKPVAKKAAVKAKTAPAKTKPAPARKPAPVAKAASKPAAAKSTVKPAAARQDVTPHLIVRGASHAIEFYRRAFGAREVFRMPSPDGFGIMHADLMIGNSHLFLCDEMPQMGTSKSPQSLGGTPVTITVSVPSVDEVYARAVEAGATATMPPEDMFWGDRYGKVLDPFGHEWALLTHQEDVAPAEMEKRFKAMVAKQANG